MKSDPVRIIRRLLDRMSRAMKMPRSEDCEAEWDSISAEVRALRAEDVSGVIDEAIGSSEARRKALIHLLGDWPNVPEAMQRVKLELANPDSRVRDNAIQIIGLRGWTQFAPELNEIILRDPDDFCRRTAVHVAGTLKQDVNFQVLMQLAEQDHVGLSRTLMKYGRTEAMPYLRRVLQRPLGPRPRLRGRDWMNPELMRAESTWSSQFTEKTIAAWGLAKLGDDDALKYLGEMLYDPGLHTRNVIDPGESFRAAEAIADVFGLPFKRDRSSVENIRKWWEDRRRQASEG